MARVYLMTWVPGRRRWTKKYKGKMYVVSPAVLGTPPTKEESYQAANAWWIARKGEIDAAGTPALDPASQTIKSILDRTSLADLRQTVQAGKAAEQVIRMLEDTSVHGQPVPDRFPAAADMPLAEVAVDMLGEGRSLPTGVIDRVLTQGCKDRIGEGHRQDGLRIIARQVSQGKPDLDPDRTVKGQVDAWVRLQHAAHIAGNISAGRYDAYKRNVGVFRDWCGPQQEIGCITATKLQDYYSHLCRQIGAGRYRPAYARSLFNASKAFIRHVAELDLIPLPGNITSRRFKFDDTPEQIVTFTVDEVRNLLVTCDGYSERTKLYLLLMLNCGMLQSDISELRHDEVAWDAGTLKRKRTKTRKKKNVPVVTYKLWPETLQLLKKFRSGDPERVLLTEDNNPLVKFKAQGEKLERYDTIQSAYSTLTAKAGIDKPLKSFRKTSSTLLEQHEVYGRYTQYFLGQAPRSVAEKHYVVPSQENFFAALGWLREQLLAVKTLR
jgi:integrase